MLALYGVPDQLYLTQLLNLKSIGFHKVFVLTAILQVNLGQPVFIEAKDDGSGGDSWSYRSCKAPVKSLPLTNQRQVFFAGRMPFLSPNQQCQSTEGNIQGAPIKNNPLEKILYLRNCSRFFHQIYAVYRGGFRPFIQQIAFKYFV